MKKILAAVLTLPLMIACNGELKKENARLTEENQQLTQEKQELDSLMNDYFESFSAIQNNLDSIRQREEAIQVAAEEGVEKSGDTKDRIIKDIEAINSLLSENKKTIADLNDKISRYSYEVGKFKKMVANLNSQIEEKDQQVLVLKERLASMNFEMEKLNANLSSVKEDNRVKQQRIEEQTEELNTAYYAIGSFDDLEENKVVDKKGGIIGIGRTKTLADDFNKDYFTRIDLTKTTSIPLEGDEDDIRVISSHPSGSYKWTMDGEKVTAIEITNPNDFWKSTKYLVIAID